MPTNEMVGVRLRPGRRRACGPAAKRPGPCLSMETGPGSFFVLLAAGSSRPEPSINRPVRFPQRDPEPESGGRNARRYARSTPPAPADRRRSQPARSRGKSTDREGSRPAARRCKSRAVQPASPPTDSPATASTPPAQHTDSSTLQAGGPLFRWTGWRRHRRAHGGAWTVTPARCPAGHPSRPGRVLAGWRPCRCGHGHHTWMCTAARSDGRECGAETVAPEPGPRCRGVGIG